MKDPFAWLENHPATIGVLAPLLALCSTRVRKWCSKAFNWLFSSRHLLREVATDVKIIKEEVQFSGTTSTKQEVELLKNHHFLDFRMSMRPKIQLDENAMAIIVSDVLCKLMGVWNPADLTRRNWLSRMEAGRIDEFIQSYQQAVKFRSQFEFAFRVITPHEVDHGEWKLILHDVTPSNYSGVIYSGEFNPMDDKAKEVAGNLHWSRRSVAPEERLPAI